MGNCLSGRDDSSGSFPFLCTSSRRIIHLMSFFMVVIELVEATRKRTSGRIRLAEELYQNGTSSIPITPIKGYETSISKFWSGSDEDR